MINVSEKEKKGKQNKGNQEKGNIPGCGRFDLRTSS